MVLVVKNLPASAGDVGDPGFNPWVRKMPWRAQQPTLVWRIPWAEELDYRQESLAMGCGP